jgi:preprotein translocase subunit SecG
MGASFGSGSSNTVFGSSGSGNFMTRTTALLAIVFFGLSLVLGNLSTNKVTADQKFSNLEVETVIDIPVEKDTSGDIPE